MALTDKDIDQQMATDWAAIQEKHAVEPEALEPIEETEPAAPDTSEPVTDRGDGRRPDGTFAPKEKAPVKEVALKEAKPGAGKEAAQPAAVAEPDPTHPAEPARDINRAPSTWKPTARAEWEKLPPPVRAEIHRREQDFLDGHKQIRPDADFGKSVRTVVEPYRMLIESEGGTPERAIGDLLRTAAQLRMGTPQQKVQIFAQVAQQYGVDLRAFAPQIGQQPDQQIIHVPPASDPRVDQLIGQLNQERQQRAQLEQQALEGTVTNWMNAQDAQGKPSRPYLGDVMNEMNALVPQIRQANPSLNHEQVLQQAYETATWGNPEIRTLLLQAQGTGQTRVPDNQNRVREARRAASVNVPRRASVPGVGKPGTLEETIATTARELGLIT
jgi:hypothetical protein